MTASTGTAPKPFNDLLLKPDISLDSNNLVELAKSLDDWTRQVPGLQEAQTEIAKLKADEEEKRADIKTFISDFSWASSIKVNHEIVDFFSAKFKSELEGNNELTFTLRGETENHTFSESDIISISTICEHHWSIVILGPEDFDIMICFKFILQGDAMYQAEVEVEEYCVWADGTYCHRDEIEEYGWKSDDYIKIQVPIDIEDFEEHIEKRAREVWNWPVSS